MSDTQRRVALVAGATGRFGEALLNRVLADGDYAEVVALAQAPMSLGVRGLALAPLHALPPLHDAFVAVAAPGAPGRSFHGRDAAWVSVEPSRLLAVAQAACAAGARRLVLVSPTPVWQQMGGLRAGLSGEAELAVAALPLSSLTVLRPVIEGGSRAMGWVERVASVYTSLQMLAMPRSMPVLRSEELARCAVAAMRRARDGVSVLGADRIPALLAPAPDPGESPAGHAPEAAPR
jgi:hypothetical protein